MIRSKKRCDCLQDNFFFVVSRNDYRDRRAVTWIISRVTLAPVLDDCQRSDKQQAPNPQNDADQKKIPNTAYDQVHSSECRASGPRLPPEICRHWRHHFVTGLAHQLADGDKLIP